jgi:hypothetical protein
MTGLAPKTLTIIEPVSSLACIKDFVLVGGTGISVQINHRLSEDLDFCKWVPTSNVVNGIDFKAIEKELSSKLGKIKTEYTDFDQVSFYTSQDVKITFFNEVGYTVPSFDSIEVAGDIRCAPLDLLGSMKIKRITFRDYYDVYVLLKEGIIALDELVKSSISYDGKLNKQMNI